jgi:hypothetical protein
MQTDILDKPKDKVNDKKIWSGRAENLSYVGASSVLLHLPSSLNLSRFLPSSLLATRNQRLLSQHNTTPTQLCAGILNILSITSWNALRGTATKVAVNGLVALTRSNVDTKTENDPSAPIQIMNQKNGTSKNGMLCTILPMPPEIRTRGVRRIRERNDV